MSKPIQSIDKDDPRIQFIRDLATPTDTTELHRRLCKVCKLPAAEQLEIEYDYVTSQKSERELAAEHGLDRISIVSHVTFRGLKAWKQSRHGSLQALSTVIDSGLHAIASGQTTVKPETLVKAVEVRAKMTGDLAQDGSLGELIRELRKQSTAESRAIELDADDIEIISDDDSKVEGESSDD